MRSVRSSSVCRERDYERVCDAIRDLANDPRPPGCKKLGGREGWRIRIGQYRAIYEIKDVVRIVTILDPPECLS